VLTGHEIEERERAAREVPELRGLDAPLTVDERLELDAALGLERVHA
jgi:hypothetical protein